MKTVAGSRRFIAQFAETPGTAGLLKRVLEGGQVMAGRSLGLQLRTGLAKNLIKREKPERTSDRM